MAKRGGVEIQVTGLRELANAVEANREAVQYALGRALWDAANQIGDASQELVPFDTGDLKGSMSYETRGIGTSTPEVEIRYGTPYALYQHEKLDLYHPARDGNTAGRKGTGPTAPGTPGGSPKYLEFPFLAETSKYPQGLVDRIRAHYRVIESRGRG
jgi:hypothetical protein